jgi:hypothetical protein
MPHEKKLALFYATPRAWPMDDCLPAMLMPSPIDLKPAAVRMSPTALRLNKI